MKKRIRFRKLNRSPSHKWDMLRNMVTSLIDHERIVTTEAKAKEVQTLAEKVITYVKRNSPAVLEAPAVVPQQQMPILNYQSHFNAFRALSPIVRTKTAMTKAVEILGPRYQFRLGGYTRIMKLAKRRHGDNAPMALIEYVDRPGEIRAARPPAHWQEYMLKEQELNGSINNKTKDGAKEYLDIVDSQTMDRPN